MKKKLTAFICTFIAAITFVFAAIGFTACEKDGGDNPSVKLLDENLVEDNYDNYYEIFVYSYNDSDGDGYGDLNGVTAKLDYIRDLGYTGIWLMPIMPANSYHGYDVTDYYDVNSKYGTLDDYDNLVEKAHEKGIKVIIDLVVNHTSKAHPWFRQALAYKKGQSGGSAKYANYYNFSNTQQDKYHNDGGIWYEGQFDSWMPDLNLADEGVREEIDNICSFWIGDHGTDGFRLDGCLYYFGSGSLNDESVEACEFIKKTAVKYNPNAYIVGETWDVRTTITEFYKSGTDSFFYFPAAGNGDIVKALNGNSALELFRSMDNSQKSAGNYIPAPFISNHDAGSGFLGRVTTRLSKDEEKIKFVYGLLSLYSGSTFTYYGDELGMIAKDNTNDPDLRVGMLWDKSGVKTRLPDGATGNADFLFGSVAEQLKNSGSILNYYKLCNNARNAFPALMRGTASRKVLSDSQVLYMTKTYKEQTIAVVVNLGTASKKVTDVQGTLTQSICVSGKIKQSGTTLTMPKYSIAILT